jgi:hypothetical protein
VVVGTGVAEEGYAGFLATGTSSLLAVPSGLPRTVALAALDERGKMVQQALVFNVELVGFEGVHRTIAIRDDLTLVDLHYALQSAFDWDDDYLYAFWLHGAFWAPDCEHCLHPLHAHFDDSLCKSAYTPLVELGSLSATGSPTSLTSHASGGSGSPSSMRSPPAVVCRRGCSSLSGRRRRSTRRARPRERLGAVREAVGARRRYGVNAVGGSA